MDIWYGIFHRILDMSVAGGIAALAVLAIRVLIRRAPKKYAYLLWGIVLFRLLCPVSLPSRFSALNLAGRAAESNGAYVSLQSAPAASSGAGGCLKIGKGNIPLWTAAGGDGKEPVPPGMGDEGDGKEIFQLGNRAGGDGKEPVQSENWAWKNGKRLLQPETTAGNMPVQEGAAVLGTPISIAFAIWLAGAGAMACSGLVSGLKLRRKAACSMRLWENVYLADYIASPFVLGLVRPRIYLPSGLGEQEQKYIILHEQHHISRRDYLVKILAFLALCLHWFNPLAWLSFHLAGNDMEMSCDEAVIRKMGDGIRAEYAESLLRFTVGDRKLAQMPLGFGEGDTKSRIKNIMRNKKPAAGITGVIALLVGAACLATDPAPAESGQGQAEMGSHGLFAASLGKSGNAAEAGQGQPAGEGNNRQAFLGAEMGTGAFREKEEPGETEFVKAYVHDAIMEKNGTFYSGEYGYDFACCSFENLKTKTYALAGEEGRKTVYYGWAYYGEYNFTEHGIEEVGRSHLPVALSFAVDWDGYTLEEYWEPGEGSSFVQDVREKFPSDIEKDALDSQKYAVQQTQDCYAQAVEYGRLNTDAIIERLLGTVCSAPLEASDPRAYIDAHRMEYQELVYYGDYTVRYFLKRFQQGATAAQSAEGKGQAVQNGGGTGLEGQIMALACEEILGLGNVLPVSAGTASTGQEWYNSLKTHRGSIVEYYEKMEAENPYTEIGIPVMLPQNRSWIQDIVREECDKERLQVKYYDSVLEGQCRLWVIKGGEASLRDRIEESLESKWGMAPEEASLQSVIPKGSPEELWAGATKSWNSIEVKVRHTEEWALATWEYGDYAFAILGENGSHQGVIDSLPKTAVGIIGELE